MNHKQTTDVLRVQLHRLSRLSQRALDCSIKGFTHGNSDFSCRACSSEHELQHYHESIARLCRRVIEEKPHVPSDLRFALVAMRLRCALETICRAAAQIAHDTTPYLENNCIAQCAALVEFGDLVNCLMRLCIVALFTKNGTHAMTVLQSREAWRRCERVFDLLREETDERADAQKISELALARSLGVVARQTHEMADAILFWLDERAGAFGGIEAGAHDAVAEPALRSPAPAAESTPDCLSA